MVNKRNKNSSLVSLLLSLVIIMALCPSLSQSLPVVVHKKNGSAKVPLDKKKVGVLGGGGTMGGIVFGFLQRAGSLWGTGMGKCSTMGACADTAVRLNRMLSKHFCLAVADESMFRLTNLRDIDAIESQMRRDNWDAIILSSSVRLAQRSVTGGTYETTPNDRTMEVYWDAQIDDDSDNDEKNENLRRELVFNVIQASQQCERIQHIVAVDTSTDLWLERLLTKGNVPYTCLLPKGNFERRLNYTYRSGIASQFQIQPAATQQDTSNAQTIYVEEFAALPVQCLQSLDWSKSRTLDVSCLKSLSPSELPPPLKRPDQEWCVQSNLLEDALSNIV